MRRACLMGVPVAVSRRGPKMAVVGQRRELVPVQCVMQWGVDGAILPWGTSIDLISPSQIEGIEIYSGPASVPREFPQTRPDNFCGVIMIWTRSG